MFCVTSLCSVLGFFSSVFFRKNYLNLFSVLQFETLQKMLHCSSAFSKYDLSSPFPYVFCLSVKLVNDSSISYTLWLFKENETAGTSEQLFQALCILWTGNSIHFQFVTYFGDYLQL